MKGNQPAVLWFVGFHLQGKAPNAIQSLPVGYLIIRQVEAVLFYLTKQVKGHLRAKQIHYQTWQGHPCTYIWLTGEIWGLGFRIP